MVFREYVEELLPQFQEANVHLAVEAVTRPGRHPYLMGKYSKWQVISAPSMMLHTPGIETSCDDQMFTIMDVKKLAPVQPPLEDCVNKSS